MQLQEPSKRKTYLDVLKIAAIFMVMFNHTGSKGYGLFTVERDSLFFPFYLGNAVFLRIVVPLFFMVSGALMLKKTEPYSAVLKRFFRFLVILVIASLIQYIYRCVRTHSAFSLGQFVVGIVREPASVQLWYLYKYLAYVLLLPVLRMIVKGLDRKGFLWIMAVYGAVGALPILEYILWRGRVTHYSDFSLFLSDSCFIYPIMGWYFGCYLKTEDLNRKTLLGLILGALAAVILISAVTYWKCVLTDRWEEDQCQTFINTLIYLPTGAVFYGVRYRLERHAPGERMCRFLAAVSGATFGLYLIENLCRIYTRPLYYALEPLMPSFFAAWIWVLAAGSAGILLVWLLKKLPFVSKWI